MGSVVGFKSVTQKKNSGEILKMEKSWKYGLIAIYTITATVTQSPFEQQRCNSCSPDITKE